MESLVKSFGGVFEGKRVLVSGNLGFKGAWLSLWLKLLGARVYGYSLKPDTEPRLSDVLGVGNFVEAQEVGDICEFERLSKFFNYAKPEVVIHMAAQPLVRLSYREPVETYRTNVMGTLNMLEAARTERSVRAFVNVTTDKCYQNREVSYAYKESDPFGGHDMYSSSKACSEILTASYRASFLGGGDAFALASARAGNVIGGGDWALDRIVPDCVRALSKGEAIIVRSPDAVRPWEHVLEPLAGYLRLAQLLLENPQEYSQGFNFGPEETSVLRVAELVDLVIKSWGSGEMKVLKSDNLHEAKLLMLDISKAKSRLGFKPVCDAAGAVKMTVDWYKNFYSKSGVGALEFTKSQIADFTAKARNKNIVWAV